MIRGEAPSKFFFIQSREFYTGVQPRIFNKDHANRFVKGRMDNTMAVITQNILKNHFFALGSCFLLLDLDFSVKTQSQRYFLLCFFPIRQIYWRIINCEWLASTRLFFYPHKCHWVIFSGTRISWPGCSNKKSSEFFKINGYQVLKVVLVNQLRGNQRDMLPATRKTFLFYV